MQELTPILSWLPVAARLRRLAHRSDPETVQDLHVPVAYRLRRWPELPPALRVAGILRALSVMSLQPVSPAWFARQAGWAVDEAQGFLDAMVLAGDAQVVATAHSRNLAHATDCRGRGPGSAPPS